MGRVVVVGAVNVDLILSGSTLPAPGETQMARNRERAFGGKGGNQASAASAWGIDTHIVAAVGDDRDGRDAIADLEKRNVDVMAVRLVDSAPTGMAAVLVDSQGQNMIAVHAGANALLTPDAVNHALATVELTSRDVLLTSAEIPPDAVLAVAEAATARGATHIHNFAPVWPGGRWAGPLPILVVNEHEAVELAGTDSRELALERLARKFEHIVMTVGPEGVYISSQGLRHWVPAVETAVVDTTGAGDTFCGVLAAEIAAGGGLQAAARAAVLAAARSVSARGARGGLPARSDLLPPVSHDPFNNEKDRTTR